MSKKSKYKYEGYGVVRDTEIDFPYHTDDIVDLLEHKDQQISDLETKLVESNESHHKNIVELTKMVTEKDRKIEELKQSQKQLAIEQLEKVEEILWNSQDIGNVIDNDKFLEKLNYLIKSLKGEE